MEKELIAVCEAYDSLIEAFDRARLTAEEIRHVAEAVIGLEPGRRFTIIVKGKGYKREVRIDYGDE